MHNVQLYLGLGGVFVSLALALSIIGVITSERQQVTRSLGVIRASSVATEVKGAQESFLDRVLTPGLGRLAGIARRFSPEGINEKISGRLDLAGNPPAWGIERILAFKSLGFVGLGLLGLLFGSSSGAAPAVLATLIGAGFGFYLPDILLYNTGIKRQTVIQRELPDALDLLTISVEAGLGFDAALSQVARNTDGPLSEELFRMQQEMQIGKGRAEAFRSLGARTNVPELSGFITAMVQAEQFGIPVANVLRVQAAEMRLKRHQRAEEAAQKVPVKILFPLVFFILPSLFVIVMGPGVITIIHNFSHK